MKKLLFILLPIILAAALPMYTKATESDSAINIICSDPCPYTSKELTRAHKRFDYVLGVIEDKIQTPLPEKLKPIDVHIGFDSDCAAVGPTHTKNASNIRGFNYKNSAGKGAICLNSDMDTILAGYSSFSHEIIHLYLFKRRNINEVTLSEAVVTAIRNHWLFQKPPKKRVCDYSKVSSRIEPLCKEYNLEYAAIPLLVARLLEIQETKQLTDDIIRQQLARLQ